MFKEGEPQQMLEILKDTRLRASGGMNLNEGDILVLPTMKEVNAGLGLRKTDMDGITDREGNPMFFIEVLCSWGTKEGGKIKQTDKLLFVPTGTFSRQVRSVDSKGNAEKVKSFGGDLSFTHGSTDKFSTTLRGGGAVLPTYEAALAAIAPHNALECVGVLEVQIKDFNNEGSTTSRKVFNFKPVTAEPLPEEAED